MKITSIVYTKVTQTDHEFCFICGLPIEVGNDVAIFYIDRGSGGTYPVHERCESAAREQMPRIIRSVNKSLVTAIAACEAPELVH